MSYGKVTYQDVEVVLTSIEKKLADDVWSELSAWDDWESFSHLPEGVKGNPMTCWWGFKWTHENGLCKIHKDVPPSIEKLKAKAETLLGFKTNAIAINKHLVSEPDTGMRWHSDYIPELREGTATISIGTHRTFQIGVKEKDRKVKVLETWELEHGDIVLWPSKAHKILLHQVLPSAGLRFSVNFRDYEIGDTPHARVPHPGPTII